MDFPRAVRPKSTSPIPKNIQISKTRFGQNCSAKVLCFAVLSASLPCAIVSEMHVVKKHAEPETLSWNSDFMSCHHDIAKQKKKKKIPTPNFAPSST